MLKKLVLSIFQKFGITSKRTENIAKHIGWSTIYKGGSIIATFLLVPLTIDYLDNEKYGIWLTISSFIIFLSFLDIGFGHGLRNKFAEAIARGEHELARAYVSCAYYSIGLISVCLIILFLLINPFVDWSVVFNTSEYLRNDLNILMPIIFTFFCLQLVTKLITSIYLADQHHSIHIKVEFLTRVVSILVIWLLTKTDGSSLLLFGSIFSMLPVTVLSILNFFGFSKKYRRFKPTIKLWKKKYLKDITGVGFKFFILQISTLVIFSTDNIIITKIYTAADVVPYNISFRYFSTVIIVYTIVVAPYWSSFTEAYTKKDFEWIKTSVNSIQKLWIFAPLGLLVMVLLADWFYGVWVGEKVKIPFDLSLSMALFSLLASFNMIYVNFINGVGKIKLQLILNIFSMIINIPLSIFFAKTLNFGLSGVILATCVSLLLQAILAPVQYYKIITNKAKGIWNK